MMAAETRRFDFENGRSVQPNKHVCFAVAFRTEASTCFFTGELTIKLSLNLTTLRQGILGFENGDLV